jgi:hypothetical protein
MLNFNCLCLEGVKTLQLNGVTLEYRGMLLDDLDRGIMVLVYSFSSI